MDTILSCTSPARRAVGGCGTALLVALLMSSGCSSSTAPSVTTWSGTLAPRPPARVAGNVGAVSRSGQTDASVQLEGGDSGAVYAWRILSGSCTSPGGDVVGRAVYPEVTTGLSGTGAAEATLARELDYQGTYAAWVFQISPADGSETVVACGEMDRTR